MSSRFSSDIFSSGSDAPQSMGGASFNLRQQQNPGLFSGDQNRADFLTGKRSFNDFQSYQQQFLLLQQQRQSLLQQQYLMRSVKQRTNNFVSPPISVDLYSQNNSLSHDFGVSSSLTQFGSPTISSFNHIIPTIIPNNNFAQLNPNIGFSNFESKPEKDKILNTLQELEKELLNDDDDEDNQEDSVITNSEWSDTFQNLMGPNSNPAQNVTLGSVSTNGSNNTTTTSPNNNMISPSPTSSCCSTSATPISAKQLIAEAASAILDGKSDIAMDVLGRLAQVGNQKGSSDQRVAFYMCHALRSRACPIVNPPPVMELYSKEQMHAMHALYDLSPCFKYALLVANLVILETIACSLRENLKTHVVDFHVGHRGQYVNILRALAERGDHARRTELRITVVETEVDNGSVAEMAMLVKQEMVKIAEKAGINLRFEVVTRKIHELTRESLGCEDDEALVVNFGFTLNHVPDESVSMNNLRDELLRRVKRLSPRAVTLVEQDMNANTAPFMTRVNEAVAYYGALFDSLEATVPKENPDRARVEEALGRKMANAVACEGRELVERAEVFGKWRARMGMAGFELKAQSPNVAESMRAKLDSGRAGNPGFSVKEEGGGVGFGWRGRTLTVASSWR